MLRHEPHTPRRWGIIVFGNPDLETLSVHVPAVNTSIFGVYGVVDGLGFSNSMFIGTRIVDDCDDQKKRKNVRIPHRPRAYPTNSQTAVTATFLLKFLHTAATLELRHLVIPCIRCGRPLQGSTRRDQKIWDTIFRVPYINNPERSMSRKSNRGW